MSSIDLVVLDVEGCITPSDRSETNIDGIKRLQHYCQKVNEGKLPPVILLTGRPAPYAEAIIQDIGALGPGFETSSVVENGAVFWNHNERVIQERHPDIPERDKIEKINKAVEKLKKETGAVQEPGKEVCISLNPSGTDIKELYHKTVEALSSGGFKEAVNITHSSTAVDITPEGVNKLSGLENILKEQEIPPDNVLGVGDSEGDLEWLNFIGHPAAPSNASQKVKEIDGVYTSDLRNSDGVAEILNKKLDAEI